MFFATTLTHTHLVPNQWIIANVLTGMSERFICHELRTIAKNRAELHFTEGAVH